MDMLKVSSFRSRLICRHIIMCLQCHVRILYNGLAFKTPKYAVTVVTGGIQACTEDGTVP